MSVQNACDLVLLAILGVAVVLDFRFLRISNRLILFGIVLAICLHLAIYGLEGILSVLWNISFPVIVLYLFYLVGALGAGDIKLFSVIGGFVNFRMLVNAMAFALVIGAAYALVKLLCARELRVRIISGLLHLWRVAGGVNSPYPKELTQGKNVIHFSLPVLLGTIAAMVLELLV